TRSRQSEVEGAQVTMMTDDKNTQSGNPQQDAANDIEFAAAPSQHTAHQPAEAPADDALAAAQAEVAAVKDQLLRALAETENVRRRAARDKEDAGKFAMAGFAREVLAVADNLHRALEAISPESVEADPALKTLFNGVQATARQLEVA